MTLEEMFSAAKATPSDIHEHLDVLRELSAKCEHVTEFGLRTGMSTIALLAGQPKTLISWDINPLSVVSQHVANLVMVAGKTSFQPRVGSTLDVTIEPTDLLFIDTLHTYKQLRDELWRHAHPETSKVKRYLVFHDTSTFGFEGEDGTQPGLRGAIRWFQKNAFPLWRLAEDRQNNNGLVVLEHVCADGHGPTVKGRCSWCGRKEEEK